MLHLAILAVWSAGMAGGAPAKRVLILLPLEGTRPASAELLRGIQRGVSEKYPAPATLVVEYTGVTPQDPADYRQRLTDWILYKYRDQKFDVLCPIGMEGWEQARILRERLWKGIPIVFGMSMDAYRGFGPREKATTGAHFSQSEEENIRSAFQMLPETRVVALVGGGSPGDRQVNRANIEFLRRAYPSVEVVDLTGLTLEEIRGRVGALPETSFVYAGPFNFDSQGRAIIRVELLSFLRKHANRPVFSRSLLGFGAGSVGGLMNGVERGGEFVGRLVGRVMQGESPDAIEIATVPPVAAVDWRELKRWNIPESRIPTGAEVRFRKLSVWEEYRTAILAVLGVVALQAFLIGVLLVERKRRRRSEGRVAETEELSRAVLSSMSGWIAILDKAGRVIRLSQNWRVEDPCRGALPMLEVGEEYRERLRSVVGEDGGREGVEEAVGAVLRGDDEVRITGYHAISGERDCWFEVRAERLARSEGGAVVTHLDVSKQRRADLERRSTLDELHHMNRVASVGQLAGALAHELAQPLASILSNAQASERFAAMESPDYGEIREALSEIVEEDRRARTIIDRMRTMLAKQTIPVKEIDLNRVAGEVCRLVGSAALLKRVSVTQELSREPVRVLGDSVPLQQVLLNLLNNGMDALSQIPVGERWLVVSTSMRDGQGEMVVMDNGAGIRAEDLPRLFEPFYTTKRDGLGMGLSICRSIIESLGGQITGENRVEGGALFRVTLPLNR